MTCADHDNVNDEYDGDDADNSDNNDDDDEVEDNDDIGDDDLVDYSGGGRKMMIFHRK